MFNQQIRTAAPDPHANRVTLTNAFRIRAKTLPRIPTGLGTLLARSPENFVDRARTPEGQAALRELRETLFEVPFETLERRAKQLWQEAVATAGYAAQLAVVKQCAPAETAVGALLHRAGEAFGLRLLALASEDSGVRLDVPLAADMSSQYAAELTERLISEWRLPIAIAKCITDWREYPAGERVSREAAAVYFAHLLAGELMHPEFVAPGSLDAAAHELGLGSEALEWVRAEGRAIRELIRALE